MEDPHSGWALKTDLRILQSSHSLLELINCVVVIDIKKIVTTYSDIMVFGKEGENKKDENLFYFFSEQ